MSSTDAPSPSKRGGSLPPCAICHAKVAIYRCPRCHTCTCSLACCRAHKEVDSKNNNGIVCNGKRDRTEYCSLRGFTDSQLASDYHFLEDVLKVSESSKRLYQGITSGGNSTTSAAAAKRARGNGTHSSKMELNSISTKPPAHPLLEAKEGKSIVQVLANGVNDNITESDKQQQSNQCNGIINGLLVNPTTAPSPPSKKGKVDPLVRQAEMKGINLLRMPSGMERRRRNTTKFNKKKGIITWKIELCFHHPTKSIADGSKDEEEGEESCSPSTEKTQPTLLKIESEASDSSSLSEELGKHLDVRPGNSTTRSRLRAFASAPRDSLILFMKRLPCSSVDPRYFELDPKAALMETLRGKTIIEFPTIDVVMDADKDRFPLFIGEVS